MRDTRPHDPSEDPFYEFNGGDGSHTDAAQEHHQLQLYERSEATLLGDINTGAIPESVQHPELDTDLGASHPFAISVRITGSGVGGDWSRALVSVSAGSYRTAGGSSHSVAPYSSTINKTISGGYPGHVYLRVPLIMDETGVDVANSTYKASAVAGGSIVLSSYPAPAEWPNAWRSGPQVYTAVRLGSWSVRRVNTSPSGVATYANRVFIDQAVTDNIALGQAGDVNSERAASGNLYIVYADGSTDIIGAASILANKGSNRDWSVDFGVSALSATKSVSYSTNTALHNGNSAAQPQSVARIPIYRDGKLVCSYGSYREGLIVVNGELVVTFYKV